MAITRFFPLRNEEGKYYGMDKGRNGPFVLYADHLEKCDHLRAEIRALEDQIKKLESRLRKYEIHGTTMTQEEFDGAVAKLFDKFTGDGNAPR